MVASVAEPYSVRKLANLSIERRYNYRLSIEDGGLQKHEWHICRDDPVHFINTWCYLLDPLDQQIWPFNLFPRQEQFIRWLEEREKKQERGMAEKSRDVGVTWMCSAYALHGFLFRHNFHVGFGSRKLEMVDKLGDPDCIFEKIRFMLYGLPEWLMPPGFNRNQHDNHCKLLNPSTNNTINGEGGKFIGVGGRRTIYFVDEAARLDQPHIVESSLSATTRVRIDVSTPNGSGNLFYRNRHSGRIPVFTFHWRDDPRKDQAYYDKFLEENGPVVTAEQLDIDYSASLEGICIPGPWVRAAVDYPLAPGLQVNAGYDVGEEGDDASVVICRSGSVVTLDDILNWGKCNTTEGAWKARDFLVKRHAKEVNYDTTGVGAGVKGTWNTAQPPVPFKTNAVSFGGACSNDVWPDKQTSKEKFLNLRAEMWWKLRVRFEKTYEHSKGIGDHAYDDLISIPNHPMLISELSVPLVEITDTGKIQLESKRKMKKRGVKSPNFADALALCFHKVKKKEFWIR